MPDAIDKILESIKKFEAENASMGAGNPNDQGLPGVASSHAPCYKDYRDSMKVLIKQWKAKVSKLKAAKDPKPEYNAAKAMSMTFVNVSNTFLKCLKKPLHKSTTTAMGGIK